MAEDSCLFCKIIAGQTPTDFVHQDERCVVVRDINPQAPMHVLVIPRDRKSTRLNSSHGYISYAVFCLKKKKQQLQGLLLHRTRAASVCGARASRGLIERPGPVLHVCSLRI